ncbi:HtaA domain-containing protein [Streptomyces sp. PR69]|uniref:HtaA domain-containing protein n=1 Tax=Streptomyces sp. PR69 TaxID=2984950 RepID=UPI002263B0C4|nr:HtaA domain-containing protein [Streptomyces sp. PR69]
MAATRRPLVLAAAVATAAALGATAFALPALAATDSVAAPAAAAPGAPPVELTDGTLEWGFKQSFRAYVTGMAHGEITAADGATQAPGNGPFTFTDGTGVYDMGTHATDTDFKGSVLFASKAHGFEIKIADVKVLTQGKGGSIQADVTLNGETQDDIDLARLDLTNVRPGQGDGGAMVFQDIPSTLTADGAKAFNGMYKEGDALDPATLSVKAAGGGKPTPPSPSPTTSAPTQKPTVEPTPTATATGPGTTGNPSGKPTGNPTTTPGDKPSTTAAADPGAIVGGTLDWGVKKSFRSYVTGPFAHGKVELSGGATGSGDGYRFPGGKGSFDADAKTLVASFDGGVRFLGHEKNGEYALDLSFSGFEIEVRGTGGTLVADVVTKDRGTGETATYENLGIASLTVPAGGLKAENGVVKLTGVPAKLTADGVKAFGGMYKEGDALDPLTVAVSLDKDAPLPGSGGTQPQTTGGTTDGGTTGGATVGGTTGGAGSLAATGADIPAGALLAAAGGVAAAGAGVVYAVRRRNAAAVI